MTDTVEYLFPVDGSDFVELSNVLFKKQVLPRGSINYKGETITFDDDYFKGVIDSFNSGAFDQVAFQLANDQNEHTLDPKRFGGEVKGYEITDKGLNALLELTTDSADLVRSNKRLGVSPRLLHNMERADGKKFKVAMHHVLGTLDPRVTGMDSWQEVALSHEVRETVDLTGEKVTVAKVGNATPPVQPDEDSLDVELANALGEFLSKGDGGEQVADGEKVVELTAEQQKVVDLAKKQQVELASQRQQILDLQLSNAATKWDAEAKQLIDDGVPPAMVELAKPLLSVPGVTVVELSNSSKVDAADIVRALLTESKGFVQLSEERGHTFDLSRTDSDEAILAQWEKEG